MIPLPPEFPYEFQITFFILAVIELVLLTSASAHAVMWRREPRAAALWIVVCVLMPLIGPLLYFTFGINRTERRARRKIRMKGSGMQACEGALRAAAVGNLEPLAVLGDRVAMEPLVTGCAIEPLWNGEEAFPLMLGAIEEARKSIGICSYIFTCDEVGKRFVDALTSAAARGVTVRLLVDALGAHTGLGKLARLLKKRNLKVKSFGPFSLLPSRLIHFNLRNHRKILLVDGRTAFSGGMNISALHLMSDPKRKGRCRDVHFRIRGPVVTQLARAFAEDWRFAANETLTGEEWFPKLDSRGDTTARCVVSGPDASLERIYWFVVGACNAARKSIRIVTPYFIPSEGLRTALISAALRGIDVKLVLPGETDHRVIEWASTAFLWELLQNGVKVFRSAPPFDHSKLIVVDDRWTLLGSSNLDPRSLRLNFELNVEAWDVPLAKRLSQQIDELARVGRPVTLAEVDGRSSFIRARDGTAKLFSGFF